MTPFAKRSDRLAGVGRDAAPNLGRLVAHPGDPQPSGLRYAACRRGARILCNDSHGHSVTGLERFGKGLGSRQSENDRLLDWKRHQESSDPATAGFPKGPESRGTLVPPKLITRRVPLSYAGVRLAQAKDYAGQKAGMDQSSYDR